MSDRIVPGSLGLQNTSHVVLPLLSMCKTQQLQSGQRCLARCPMQRIVRKSGINGHFYSCRFRASGLHWNPAFNIAIGAGTNDLATIILDEPVQADTSGNYDNPQITPRTVVGAKDSASKNVEGVKMLSYPSGTNEQYGWAPLSTSRMHESDGDLTVRTSHPLDATPMSHMCETFVRIRTRPWGRSIS